MPVTKDGRLIAYENQKRVLRALSRFGWLKTKDLAALCWGKWESNNEDIPTIQPINYSKSSIRSAQITLRRMRNSRFVLRALAPDGAWIYSLSERGAIFLRSIGIQAKTGKDVIRGFSLSQYRHRSVSNAIAISALLQGYRVSTEREIAQGKWLGGLSGINGKKPDVIIKSGKNIYWIEVERSRKNSKDYFKLIEWINKISKDKIHLNHKIEKVIFICRRSFQRKIISDLIKFNNSSVDFLDFEVEKFNLDELVFNI